MAAIAGFRANTQGAAENLLASGESNFRSLKNYIVSDYNMTIYFEIKKWLHICRLKISMP
jgi:hypothetical protein